MTDSKNKTALKLPPTKKIKLPSSSENSKRLKNAASQDLGTVGSGNDVLSSPNSSRSPEESVFSIDHILESILGQCDRQTLLTSRPVSCRWAFYGSKELQKTVSILFHKSPFVPGEPRTCQFLTNKHRSLKDLTTVMNNSPEFPCTSLDFRDELEGRTRQTSAQLFFDTHGAAIKKIKFEYLSIDDLKRFLLSQAPNLQQLHLGEMVKAKYTHSNKRHSNSETEEERFERMRSQKSLYDETVSKRKPILKNLKMFRCRVSLEVPEICIQQILECSPNLVDVALPSDYLHLLVQPTNRVHLVNKLIIDINSSNIESHELFANHLQDNENFAVRKLCYVGDENYDDDGDEKFHARVTNDMRKILEASSATCRKLVWLVEVDNLRIPRMPQVKQLTINYYLDEDTDDIYDLENIVPVHSLRDCVSLGDTFPNLKHLELRSRTDMGFHPMANIFNDVDPLPAANLKTVTMRLSHLRRKVVRSFEKMFPNASFSKKVETFGDDVSDSDSDNGSDYDETDNDEDEKSDRGESAGDESGDDENKEEENGDDGTDEEEYDEWAVRRGRQ